MKFLSALLFCRLGHGVARGISSMQIGKRIDLSIERKCLRWEGGPPYIDFLRGYICDGYLNYDSSYGVSRSSCAAPYVA